MKKREQGILTVEASAVLTMMLLCILFLFGFGRVYRAQNLVSHATLQSADAVAIESYLRETAHQSDAAEVVTLASQITGSNTISVEGLESLRSANLPKIAKQKFIAAIAKTEAEADEKLKSMGVKGGIAGIDFSNCTMDLSKDDVIIAIQYTIEMQFPLFGANEITVTKSAKAKTFGEILFAVTTEPSVPGWGTTEGDDHVMHGDTVTISAKANYGYKFVGWNDGVTDNPRVVTVTDAQHYIAVFEKESFGVNIRTKLEYDSEVCGIAHSNYGSFTGAATYKYLDNAVLTATPAKNYLFKGWDIDGNGTVDNPNTTMTLSVDKTYNHIQAIFKPKTYTVKVQSNNGTFGSASATQKNKSGTSIQVEYGSKVVISAILSNSTLYKFSGWSDNSTVASRSVTVTGDVSYTAKFEHNTCTITFYNGDNQFHSTTVIIGSSIDGSKSYVNSSMPGNNPIKSDVTFKEWSYNGSKFTSSTKVSKDISVDAKYQYTVRFVDSNNKQLANPITKDIGVSMKMPEVKIAGYDFSGWDGNGTSYKPGKEYTINKNVTLKGSYSCNHSKGYNNPVLHQFFCKAVNGAENVICQHCQKDCRPSGIKNSYELATCKTCGHTKIIEKEFLNLHHGINGYTYNSNVIVTDKASGNDDFEATCGTGHVTSDYSHCATATGFNAPHNWKTKQHIICSYCKKFEQPERRTGYYGAEETLCKKMGAEKASDCDSCYRTKKDWWVRAYWCGTHISSSRQKGSCPTY